ncbi:MAG: ral secretion pathway protein [Variibacter sp.]|jgi:general secretion pathway protein E|nr:ral secretion pathway protein [Variibacter sp.]
MSEVVTRISEKSPADLLADFYDHLHASGAVNEGTPPLFNLAEVRRSGKALYKLWEATDLSADGFADAAADFFGQPRVSLQDLLAAKSLADGFSQRFLRESIVFPYLGLDGRPKLVLGDPTDTSAVRAAEIVLGQAVDVEVASFDDIATVLGTRLEEVAEQPDQTRPELGRIDDDVESLRDLASGAPVVRAVNDLLEKAVEFRATDIHIEPFRSGLVVRMRIDGLLRAVQAPSDAPAPAVVSRIKILAGLNIAERRLPQDGGARLHIGRTDVDIRVATMPTQFGESAVIRLLPQDRGLLDVGKLGLSVADQAKLIRLLALPHGIIVVTGPTGSGKTTTLATMLTMLNEPTRKILTIEDPVEYEISGINQSQVKPGIGLTFATAMRAFVRQDPDVIMVGEVRDAETAHISIHAALTGHLVLTTLHTETAPAAVPRLIDLGLEAFLLRSTLRGVIGQRLIRMLCERCKRSSRLETSDLMSDPRYAALGLKAGESIAHPVGCERCSGTGYRGRQGVYEILEVNSDVRPLIDGKHDSTVIDETARRGGMTTMLDDAVEKCRAGLTSPAEALRVVALR